LSFFGELQASLVNFLTSNLSWFLVIFECEQIIILPVLGIHFKLHVSIFLEVLLQVFSNEFLKNDFVTQL